MDSPLLYPCFVLCERSEIAALQTSAASMAVVKLRYAQELAPFFAACSALAADVVAPAGGAAVLPVTIAVQLQPVNQQASLVLVTPPVQAQNARAQAHAVVAAQNFGRRKQTRDMLQRY
jgi:hypothetical protein